MRLCPRAARDLISALERKHLSDQPFVMMLANLSADLHRASPEKHASSRAERQTSSGPVTSGLLPSYVETNPQKNLDSPLESVPTSESASESSAEAHEPPMKAVNFDDKAHAADAKTGDASHSHGAHTKAVNFADEPAAEADPEEPPADKGKQGWVSPFASTSFQSELPWQMPQQSPEGSTASPNLSQSKPPPEDVAVSSAD